MESAVLRFILMALAGWWSDRRQAAVAYLTEENRVLRAQALAQVGYIHAGRAIFPRASTARDKSIRSQWLRRRLRG